MLLYIASQDAAGGILRCRLTPAGQIHLIEKIEADRPAYLCREGRRLYAALREPFDQQSGVVGYDMDADGALRQATEVLPTHGPIGCHITAAHGRVYCANYFGGSTILLPDKVLAHSGHGKDGERQRCSHPHCVTPAPDGAICINDLGTDCIYVCTPELVELSRVCLPPGSGPRHLVFSPDGEYAYCSNELTCTAAVLRYERGRLHFLRSYDVVLPRFKDGSLAAAIRLRDGRLYVSSRGYGSVCVFDVQGAELEKAGEYRLPGAAFRECALAGRFLLCGDDAGSRVLVYDLASGFDAPPVSEFAVKHPWGILPVEQPEG